ncbi:MAG: hypothetical protein HY710_04455, partial [Candidatus Latescibacteria bacterium]|nr:hypothetical protein [Candidatus Latescibacterota bacterium]
MAETRRFVHISLVLTSWMLTLATPLPAQEPAKSHPEKTMTAVRINPRPPVLDGVLDDEVWQSAPSFTGFTQKDPKEGEPATEKTTVQLIY